MNRNEWLQQSLTRYLDRRSMPQGLKDKPQAQRDEMAALARALIKLAPLTGYQDWCADFIDRLAMDAQTRAWPTQSEMQAAAKALRKSAIQPFSEESRVQIDPLKMAANRIRQGEAVGAGYLWGALCIQMQDQEGITDAQLAPYRSALFFADKNIVDESAALEREAGRKAQHEIAKQRIWKGERGQRQVPDVHLEKM